MHQGSGQRHEHACENYIAQEMRTLRYAHEAGGKTQKRARDQSDARPLGQQQRRSIEGHEDRGRLPADERAIVRALIGGDQWWREDLAAAELDDLLGPRPPPMVLEDNIGDESRSDGEADRQEQPLCELEMQPSARSVPRLE